MLKSKYICWLQKYVNELIWIFGAIFQVVQQQMTARGLGDEQCREMEVEDDLECECGCRISEEDCLSTQVTRFLIYWNITFAMF